MQSAVEHQLRPRTLLLHEVHRIVEEGSVLRRPAHPKPDPDPVPLRTNTVRADGTAPDRLGEALPLRRVGRVAEEILLVQALDRAHVGLGLVDFVGDVVESFCEEGLGRFGGVGRMGAGLEEVDGFAGWHFLRRERFLVRGGVVFLGGGVLKLCVFERERESMMWFEESLCAG